MKFMATKNGAADSVTKPLQAKGIDYPLRMTTPLIRCLGIKNAH